MGKLLWLPVFLGLMVCSAKAQTLLLTENGMERFYAEHNTGRDKPIPNSGSTSNNQASGYEGEDSFGKRAALSEKEKFHYLVSSACEIKSVLFSLAGAGINQARDYVPEWGQGMEGYGKRAVSLFGQKATRLSVQFGIGYLLGEDPRYFFSKHPGIWRRTFHAATRTLVSRKDSGKTGPAYSKLIGLFGAACISRQWYPERDRTPARYLSAGAISVGVDAAKNVFAEFWPDMKRRFRR